MTDAYIVGFSGTATVVVSDDRVFLRVTENRDDQDIPEGAPGHDPAAAFRAHLYNMLTVEHVLQMLIYNAAAIGRRRASDLDGWADLDRYAAVTDVQAIYVDDVTVEND